VVILNDTQATNDAANDLNDALNGAAILNCILRILTMKSSVMTTHVVIMKLLTVRNLILADIMHQQH
jgi:hypothetical protein